ncbi:hypothetical protein TRFO_25742 [Tritrichomonas foetus]|uniref:Nucleotide-diphospho-sugar transferase domain-containing protein n=1 Tax=Tritrichomonas foetus TaxID=1144522 RepID=A0A1J4K5V4_9EUKA|nr:hypothetical protein TRFO_25742 [Tritrichomonas foetus]|eukprot:OHT06256.1 hypothetical protein TRFO_25742 [Tritrichomonas foetus]
MIPHSLLFLYTFSIITAFLDTFTSVYYKFEINLITQKFLKDYHLYCVPYIKQKSFSTPRDLAITTVIYGEKHVPLNLFSIRQGGCQASIVVIVNADIKLQRETIKVMNCLQVKLVKCPFTPKMREQHNVVLRSMLLANYVRLYIDYYDRVFFFDAFDVFFNADPFEYFIGDNLFLFQESMGNINQNCYNNMWVKECFGDEGFQRVKSFRFLCAGTVGGTARRFVEFYDLMRSTPNWSYCRIDQGQINYWVYVGLLDQMKIPFTLFSHFGPVQTLMLGPKYYNYYYNDTSLVYMTNGANKTVPIIHQTKSVKNVQEGLYARCNMTNIVNDCLARDDVVLNSIIINISDY